MFCCMLVRDVALMRTALSRMRTQILMPLLLLVLCGTPTQFWWSTPGMFCKLLGVVNPTLCTHPPNLQTLERELTTSQAWIVSVSQPCIIHWITGVN